MRIALLAPLIAPLGEPPLGGVQAFLADLSRGLAGRGHEVTVFAASGSRLDGVRVVDTGADAQALRASLFRPGKRRADDAESEAAFTAVFAMVADGAFDVLHNHAYDVPAIRQATRLDCPVLHTLHLPGEAVVAAALESARRSRHPPLTAAVSEAHAAGWRKLTPIDHVLRPGIPVADIPWSAAGGNRLLFAGRLSPEKGAPDAVAIARAAGRPLTIVGPAYDPEHAAQVARLAAHGTVELKAALDRHSLWREMAGCAAVLFPVQWEEPFGLVPAEANACGTPVVAYRRGGIPEVVAEGVTAVLVSPGDIEGAAAGVRHAELLSRHACRRHAERTLAMEPSLAAHERLYREAMQGGGSRLEPESTSRQRIAEDL